MDFELEIQSSKNLSNFVFNKTILYGIPSETADRRKEGDKHIYNNAEILAVMEAGSAVNNVPSRELLRPVAMLHKEEIVKALGVASIFYLEGNETEGDKQLELLAIQIENWLKMFFNDPNNGWAPNSPITINGGWMKNKKSGKPFYVKGKKSSKPLIDTGSLRQSLKAFVSKV